MIFLHKTGKKLSNKNLQSMATLATLADLKAFDVTKLEFSAMKKPDNAVSSGISARPSRAQIKYNGSPLRLQTPMMYLPFKYEGDPNNTSLTFCTKCDGISADDTEYANEFNSIVTAVQNRAYEVAKENSNEWFGKSPASFTETSDNFTFSLKDHPEGKYPPQIKVKYFRADSGSPQFPIWDGTTNTVIHTRSAPSKVSCPDIFAKNTRHVIVIDCMGIWCLNKRGGITWRMNDVLSYGVAQDVFPFTNVAPPSVTVTSTQDVYDDKDVLDAYQEAAVLAE